MKWRCASDLRLTDGIPGLPQLSRTGTSMHSNFTQLKRSWGNGGAEGLKLQKYVLISRKKVVEEPNEGARSQ